MEIILIYFYYRLMLVMSMMSLVSNLQAKYPRLIDALTRMGLIFKT